MHVDHHPAHPENKEAPEFLAFFGLGLQCTPEDVRESYRRLAQEMHPDRGGDVSSFRILQKNYSKALKFTGSRLQDLRPHNFQLSPYQVARAHGRKLSRKPWLLFAMVIVALLVSSVFLGLVVELVIFAIAFGIFLSVPLISSAAPPTVAFGFFAGSTILFFTVFLTTVQYFELNAHMKATDWDALAITFLYSSILSLVLMISLGIGWLISLANFRDS